MNSEQAPETQVNARKREQTQTNANKREQTQKQKITPLFTHPLSRQPKVVVKESNSSARSQSVGSLPSGVLWTPQEPRRALAETPPESSENPSESQISSESLADGCAPSDVDPPEL